MYYGNLESTDIFLRSKNLNYWKPINQLLITVYSKQTVSHLYLHADSNPLKILIIGVQKGFSLALGCISNSVNDYTANYTAR